MGGFDLPQRLAVTQFTAKRYDNDATNAQGLPLQPPSSNVVGRGTDIVMKPYDKCGKHPGGKSHLLELVACERGLHDRVFVVQEHKALGVEDIWNREDLNRVQVVRETVMALCQMQRQRGLSNPHGQLTLECIRIRTNGSNTPDSCDLSKARVKLSNWYLSAIVDQGDDVDHPMGEMAYWSPERLALAAGQRMRQVGAMLPDESTQITDSEDGVKKQLPPWSNHFISHADDAFALGVVTLEIALRKKMPRDNLAACFDRLSCTSTEAMLASLLRMLGNATTAAVAVGLGVPDGDAALLSFLDACLHPHPRQRAAVADLIAHPFLSDGSSASGDCGLALRSEDTVPTPVNDNDEPSLLELRALFHLWQITSGGDLWTQVTQGTGIHALPPANAVPAMITRESVMLGTNRDRSALFDGRWWDLSLMKVRQLFKATLDKAGITTNSVFTRNPLLVLNGAKARLNKGFSAPMLGSPDDMIHTETFTKQISPKAVEMHVSADSEMPVAIKEANAEYQMNRIAIFRQLLHGLPASVKQLRREARRDIPPLLRNEVWYALLRYSPRSESAVANFTPRSSEKQVEERKTHRSSDMQSSRYTEEYMRLDRLLAADIDHQIEVDIPRCHQYETLLSATLGREKLRCVLKSWSRFHEEAKMVYWQGIDSISAPFVCLNYGHTDRAFACLELFIQKYLPGFFQASNSDRIQLYLVGLRNVMAFHSPTLHNHMMSIEFGPDLFAIPWLLTMFTHIFPLQRIYHLWDTLLVSDSHWPIHLAFAILEQMQGLISGAGFNECILIFSDLPEADLQTSTRRATDLNRLTPPSLSIPPLVQLPIMKADGTKAIEDDRFRIHTLKMEPLGRISAEDLAHLLHYTQASKAEQRAIAKTFSGHDDGDTVQSHWFMAPLLCFDCRPLVESLDDHLPHSVLIASFHASELPLFYRSYMETYRTSPLVVLYGTSVEQITPYAEALLTKNVPGLTTFIEPTESVSAERELPYCDCGASQQWIVPMPQPEPTKEQQKHGINPEPVPPSEISACVQFRRPS
eukprot:Clim_evm20s13 gene=Clim_evmTU20s13